MAERKFNFPFKTVLLVALVLFFAFSPYDFEQRAAQRRFERTSNPDTPMEIALVWPRENSGAFVEGALLAVEEINKRGGVAISDNAGSLKKALIKAHVFEEIEQGSFDRIRKKIVNNPNLSAVIGHHRPEQAIKSSVNYDETGLLFLSPVVSDPHLTLHGFRLTIQSAPHDRDIASAIVGFAVERGWRRPAILHVRNAYGTDFSAQITEHIQDAAIAREEGHDAPDIQVAFKGFYSEGTRSFYMLISDLLDQKFDSVFVVDSLLGEAAPRTVALIHQLRRMGVSQPIIGSDELHSSKLWDTLGHGATNIFAGALVDFQSTNSSPRALEFKANFAAKYKKPPTIAAGQAFEAVHLIAQAAERAQSKVPIQMATMFKSTEHWYGLESESYEFSSNGQIAGKKVYIEGVHGPEFRSEGDGVYSFSKFGAIIGKKVHVEELKDGEFIATEGVGATNTAPTNTRPANLQSPATNLNRRN